jgi:hypothetical protein
MTITENSHAGIADLSGARIFGEDGSILAFLDVANAPAPDDSWHFKCSLLIIDTMASVIITNLDLNGIVPVPMRAPLGQYMAVDAKNSEAYIPTFDHQAPNSFGFAEANWKTRMLQIHTNSYKDLSLPYAVITIPSGFGMSFLDHKEDTPRLTAALFDAATQTHRLVPLIYTYGKSSGIGQMLFLPTVGLIQYSLDVITRSTNAALSANLASPNRTRVPTAGMEIAEHRHPALFQLTDSALSTNGLIPAEIPVSAIASEIFARTSDGKPCLVWGEKADPESQDSAVSDIVIFDWNSKRELLRKDIGTSTTTFQPSADGSRVYFLDSKDGMIKFLDVKSRNINPFSAEPVPNPAGATIVAAY